MPINYVLDPDIYFLKIAYLSVFCVHYSKHSFASFHSVSYLFHFHKLRPSFFLCLNCINNCKPVHEYNIFNEHRFELLSLSFDHSNSNYSFIQSFLHSLVHSFVWLHSGIGLKPIFNQSIVCVNVCSGFCLFQVCLIANEWTLLNLTIYCHPTVGDSDWSSLWLTAVCDSFHNMIHNYHLKMIVTLYGT